MNALFGVGLIAILIGAILLYYGYGGKVKAKTQFGDFEGPIGAVAVIFGLVLMGFGVL